MVAQGGDTFARNKYTGRRRDDGKTRAEHQILGTTLFLENSQWTTAAAATNGLSQQNKIPHGLYEFPFTIELPSSLPGSVSFNPKCQSGFSLSYTMLASTGHTNGKSKDIHVQPRAAATNTTTTATVIPCTIPPTLHKIKVMRTIQKGYIALAAKVDNTVLSSSQKEEEGDFFDLNLSLSCRNLSTVSIKSVELALVERLSWTVTPRRWTEYSDTSKEITLWQLPDVVPLVDGLKLSLSKQSSSSSASRSIPPADDKQKQLLFADLQKDLASSPNTMAVPIPRTIHARNSYEGTLIKISHVLRVTFYTDTGATNPTVSIPFQVGDDSPATSYSGGSIIQRK
jgi:hypothetical protein